MDEYDLKLLFLFSVSFLYILYITHLIPVQPTREQEFDITPFNLTPLITFNLIPYGGIATLIVWLLFLLIFFGNFSNVYPSFKLLDLPLTVLLSTHQQTPAHKAYLFPIIVYVLANPNYVG